MRLDHFYLAVATDTFDRLKKLGQTLPFLQYKRTERPDAVYEGIYIYSSCGKYFEILKESEQFPESTLGIAFNDLENEENTAESLLTRPNDLTMEIISKEGKEWFKAVSEPFSPSFFCWFMEYLGDFKSERQSYKERAVNDLRIIDASWNPPIKLNEIEQKLSVLNLSIESNYISSTLKLVDEGPSLTVNFNLDHRDHSFSCPGLSISIQNNHLKLSFY